MSQKRTLHDRYLPKIKQMLTEGKTQIEMSQVLNIRRETVNRKIHGWMKTEDFDTWLKEVWMHLYGEVVKKDPVEAFKQVTRIFTQTVNKTQIMADVNEITLKWQQDEPNPNSTVQAARRTSTVPPEPSTVPDT